MNLEPMAISIVTWVQTNVLFAMLILVAFGGAVAYFAGNEKGAKETWTRVGIGAVIAFSIIPLARTFFGFLPKG